MKEGRGIFDPLDSHFGLCAACAHVRRIVSSRGSVFFMCRRAETDDRFVKYPVLPVLRCSGYEPAGDAGRGEQKEKAS